MRVGESRIVLIQTTVPDYRTRFFEELSRRLGPGFLLLSGKEDWHRDVRHVGGVPYVAVRNVFVARRRLLWQAGAIRPLLAADVAVVGLNPRILSSWIVLLGRRLAGRRTVLWGHAWPRKGRKARTDRVRGLMRRLADTLIVYTETEAARIAGELPGTEVRAAPNALYRRGEMGLPSPATPPTDLVCVGRLTASKKPDLLLEAFATALPRLPAEVRLVFVGDGPLRAELENRSRAAGTSDRVLFTGHLSSIEELRSVFARAIASISPGDAGLSLIQSLGFGVPMIVGWIADHGPEIEAAVEGSNVVFFSPDSPKALASTIVDVIHDRERWSSRREAIARATQTRYTIETMVESFVDALERSQTVSAEDGRRAQLTPPVGDVGEPVSRDPSGGSVTRP